MRRSLHLAVAAVLLGSTVGTVVQAVVAERAGAAIAVLQTGTEKTSTTGSVSPTLPASSTAGTLLVAVLANSNTAASAPFSGPTGWASASGVYSASVGRVEIWYYVNNPGGITTATFTASSGTNTVAAQLVELRGAAFATPVDQTGTVTKSSSTTATVSTTGATTVAGDVGIAFFATSVKPITTFTAGTGWAHVLNDGTRGFVADDKLGNAVGTLSETETASSSTSWAGVVVAFMPGCTGGSLTLGSPTSVTFPTVTLNGKDQSVTTTGAFTPNDQTNTNSGWNVSGTSTTFTTGTRTLPTTATQVTAASASTATQNCSLPTNSIAYPLTLPAGATAPTAIKLYNAAANSGAGPSNVTLTFKLTSLASAFRGTYTSTWTFTISSGP